MATYTFAADAVPALSSWEQGTSKQQAQQRAQQRHLDRVQQHQQREQQRAQATQQREQATQQREQQREEAAQQREQQKHQQRELARLGVDAQEGRGARVKRPPKRDEPESPGEAAQKSFLPCHMWTPEEDKRMIGGVHKFGLNWEKVAEQLPGRSAGAVRKHYVGDLLPQVGNSSVGSSSVGSSSQKKPEPKPKPKLKLTPTAQHASRKPAPLTPRGEVAAQVLSDMVKGTGASDYKGEVPEATEIEGLLFWSMPRRPLTFEPAPKPTAVTHGEAAAAKQCPPDARRARRRSVPPPPSSTMLEPSAMAVPNREAAAEVEELPCGAAAAAAAMPAHRAKRPQLRATAHDIAEQLVAAPPRRSRRDKPTLEVGRRVRATFQTDESPRGTWFFGVVLGAATTGGNLLVGFDDGKQEHVRVDQLTIVDDDDDEVHASAQLGRAQSMPAATPPSGSSSPISLPEFGEASLPEGIKCGDNVLAAGLHAGQRKSFLAVLVGVRNVPSSCGTLLVRYVSTPDGKTIPLLLPEVRLAYVTKFDVAKFDESSLGPRSPFSAMKTRGRAAAAV